MRLVGCFAIFLLAACTGRKDVTIHWEKQQAVGLVIPQSVLPGFSKDSLHLLQVQLAASILGEYTVTNDVVEFQPLIPFTRGLTYQVTWKGALVQQVKIPGADAPKPAVVSIYPSGDSLPENLLKMYVAFSKPMREGQALQNIAVIKNGRDTIPSIFLDLEPELWNRDRTVLTVWLDPGRIKRDLQPNKELGTPLQAGNRYEIIIQPGWQDADGSPLESAYRTSFVAVGRDGQSPDPSSWTIQPPQAGTRNPLQVSLHEQLDYMLLTNAISITINGQPVPGAFQTNQHETMLYFTPAQAWASGRYTMQIEPRLEDLAGNNLERLFDKDLLADTANRKKNSYERVFQIRP